MNQAIDTSQSPDFSAVKAKQLTTWASGDYAAVGTTLQITGEQLCESANLRPGCSVLDVAAGNGNASLAAARRFCQVTSTDYVESLLDKGKLRAQAEHLPIEFQLADAENLPFDDGQFDAVLSTFGVMFTPDHQRSANEMLRVCRPGGTIAMANWTPEGFIGKVFGVIGKHLPPPAGLKPPSRWGATEGIKELFSTGVQNITVTKRQFNFRYMSIDHFLDFFGMYYGPIHKAFEALGDKKDLLRNDLAELMTALNVADDGTLLIPSEYAEVVITKAD